MRSDSKQVHILAGARMVGTLAKLLSKNPGSRGLNSICTAGGMGIAAVLES